jgi:UDP-glucose:(heptosyl)LPS alpha-1,3-glucosyltransferase
MKLAMVLFNWFPHGGLQRDCRGIGETLVARGASCDVLCMSWEGPVPEGMRPVIVESAGGSKVARRRAFAAFVRQHLSENQYDMVLGFNRVPGLDFYYAADTCFAWKAYRERSWWYRLTPRCRQYLAFERAVLNGNAETRILLLSPLQRQEYLSFYPDAENRMVDLPPGIERRMAANEEAHALRQSLRHEFRIKDEQLLVLQVGSGFRTKGVDRSLRAVAALPDSCKSRVRLFVVGRDKAEKYMQQAASLGIESCVTFISARDDLPRFYQGADVLLHPSRKESAGMVILEAIVAGLPVLTTASCGYAFHVKQANAGLVVKVPFRQEALNQALAEILESPQRPTWQENGRHYGRTADLYDMPVRVASMVEDWIREKAGGA